MTMTKVLIVGCHEDGSFSDDTDEFTQCPDCGKQMEFIGVEKPNNQTVNIVYGCKDCFLEIRLGGEIPTNPEDNLSKETVDQLLTLHQH